MIRRTTDLSELQANVEGAGAGCRLRGPPAPAGEEESRALRSRWTKRFTELQTELDKYRKGDGFVLYTDLSKAQVKELSRRG